MAINMKSFLRLLAVVLLAFCFSIAVGCKDKDYTADYSNNDMPTLGSKVETTESGSTETEQQGEDNIVDIDDLLNPDKNKGESSQSQGNSSAKPSTGSSSTSGSSSATSSKPSSSSSSQASSSSKPSSSQSTSSVENDMATGTEKDTASYNTPGWIL